MADQAADQMAPAGFEELSFPTKTGAKLHLYVRKSNEHVQSQSQPASQHDTQSQAGHGTLGQRLWPCASALCDCFEFMPALVKDKHVLELGSGSGLCGLFARACGAKSVVVTDLEGPILQSLCANVTLNKATFCGNGRNQSGLCKSTDNPEEDTVVARALDWRSASSRESVLALSKDRRGFDCIVASDVSYDFRIIEPMLETVNALLPTDGLTHAGEVAVVVILHEHRPWLHGLDDEDYETVESTETETKESAGLPTDARGSYMVAVANRLSLQRVESWTALSRLVSASKDVSHSSFALPQSWRSFSFADAKLSRPLELFCFARKTKPA